MRAEEDIKEKISARFPAIKGSIRIPRDRRIFLDVPILKFRELMEFSVKDLEFRNLNTITGLDEGENLSFIYHFSKDNGIMVNIKTSITKQDPVIKTITDIFPNAEIYERELVDLFGAKVEGLSPGNRYPLTDDWPKGEYPLRKDWKMKEGECQ